MPGGLEPVNVYVLDTDDGLVVVDTGIRSKRNLAALHDELRAMGAEMSDVRHLLLTHGHSDHFGLAAAMAEATELTVWGHPETKAEVERVFEAVEPADHPAVEFFRSMGVPERICDQVIVFENFMLSTMQAPVKVDRTVVHGDLIELPPFRLRVIHTPGHCPGHVMLFDEPTGRLFCGDHIHPNHLPVCPMIVFPPRPISLDSLREQTPRDVHRASLAANADLPVKLHLPGHGAPFEALAPVLSRYAQTTKKRAAALLDATQTSQSVYAVSKGLFGGRADVVTLLTVGETLFTAIDLERQGRLGMAHQGGLLHLRATP
jgi:glyoxylase-like metal-dependent hydrolase (beta-lactamase superfamily II)